MIHDPQKIDCFWSGRKKFSYGGHFTVKEFDVFQLRGQWYWQGFKGSCQMSSVHGPFKTAKEAYDNAKALDVSRQVKEIFASSR